MTVAEFPEKSLIWNQEVGPKMCQNWVSVLLFVTFCHYFFTGSGLKWKTSQFLVLLLLFSCSRLIRLQDFLTTNISGSNASISLIFCVEISLRRGIIWGCSFWLGVCRHARLLFLFLLKTFEGTPIFFKSSPQSVLMGYIYIMIY